jgi:hypothetical protein
MRVNAAHNRQFIKALPWRIADPVHSMELRIAGLMRFNP